MTVALSKGGVEFAVGAALAEAREATRARGWRSVFTALGITLSVVSLVVISGISASGRAAVSAEFDRLRATSLAATYTSAVPPMYIDPARVERVDRLPGVVGAGLRVSSDDVTLPISNPAAGLTSPGSLKLYQADALRSSSIRLVSGRTFDAGHEARGDRVAIVGLTLARELFPQGGEVGSTGALIEVGGLQLAIVGVVDSSDPIVTTSVIAPLSLRDSPWEGVAFQGADWLVDIEPGYGNVVQEQLPRTLLPEMPNELVVLLAIEPLNLRAAVDDQTKSLVFALSMMAALIGALAIYNAMQVAVLQRRSEIGVRRAIGASRAEVALQFVAEGALLGFIGGSLGAPVGIGIALVVPYVQDMPVVVPWTLALAAPLLGGVVGLVAAVWPAIRALSVQPSEALRTD